MSAFVSRRGLECSLQLSLSVVAQLLGWGHKDSCHTGVIIVVHWRLGLCAESHPGGEVVRLAGSVVLVITVCPGFHKVRVRPGP